MIDSIKLKTHRQFKIKGWADGEQSQSAPSSLGRNKLVGNLLGDLKSMPHKLGLSGDWYREAKFSTTYVGGEQLRLNLKFRDLGIALFGTATHLERIHLTLPMLWSGNSDNIYVFKSEEELKTIRRAVYEFLDQITWPPPAGSEYVSEIHLCYQADIDFADIEQHYEYARTRLVKKQTSVTPGEEILYRGKLVELAIYKKKNRELGSPKSAPARFEVRFKDIKKIREYFGVDDGKYLDFRSLTIDRMLKALHKVAGTLKYPSPPKRSEKPGKKRSEWSVYHTLAAIEARGWTHPIVTGEEETWMSGLTIVDIHTRNQCDKSSSTIREKVRALVLERQQNLDTSLYKSLSLSDLLPKTTAEWEQTLSAQNRAWSAMPFVGLPRLRELWFDEDAQLGDSQPPIPALLSKVLLPLPKEFSHLGPFVFHSIVEHLESQKGGSDPNPFPFIPTHFQKSQKPSRATLETVAFYYCRGANPGVGLSMAESQWTTFSLSRLGCTPHSDALEDGLYTGPLATFWATRWPGEQREELGLIHLNDFRAYAADTRFSREWQFQPSGDDESVPPEERSKWYDLDSMKALIAKYNPEAGIR